MLAAQQGDSAQVQRFTPMALGAYAQLDTFDADARYHAAVSGSSRATSPGAHALADTILEQSPDNLLGYLVRGTAAGFAEDPGRPGPGRSGSFCAASTGRWPRDGRSTGTTRR